MAVLFECGYMEHADCFGRQLGTYCSAMTLVKNDRSRRIVFRDASGKIKDCPFYKKDSEISYEEIERSVKEYAKTHPPEGRKKEE